MYVVIEFWVTIGQDQLNLFVQQLLCSRGHLGSIDGGPKVVILTIQNIIFWWDFNNKRILATKFIQIKEKRIKYVPKLYTKMQLIKSLNFWKV